MKKTSTTENRIKYIEKIEKDLFGDHKPKPLTHKQTAAIFKLAKKRQREGKRIIQTTKEDDNEVIKTVGQNSKNSGRIYLPGSWIGKNVIVTLVK